MDEEELALDHEEYEGPKYREYEGVNFVNLITPMSADEMNALISVRVNLDKSFQQAVEATTAAGFLDDDAITATCDEMDICLINTNPAV